MSKIRQESRADKSGGLERGGEEIRSGAVRGGQMERGGGAGGGRSVYQFYDCVFVQGRLRLINVQETLLQAPAVYALPFYRSFLLNSIPPTCPPPPTSDPPHPQCVLFVIWPPFGVTLRLVLANQRGGMKVATKTEEWCR